MSKWIVSLAAVALSAMMFSGCGGESGSSAVDGGNGGGQDSEQRAAMNEPDAIGSLPPVPMVPTK